MEPMIARRVLLAAAVVCAAGLFSAARAAAPGPLLAGARAIDITPRTFPVYVNGMFTERKAGRAQDRLHARCLVLAAGPTRLAVVVVDSCLIPRSLLDEAKALASAKTGIPTENMLISATHTHSAPAAMGALGCPADAGYVKFLPGRIAEGIRLAAESLTPARVGHAVVDAPGQTNCRRWILRPDKVRFDPFGRRTVRAMMHPGYQNPDFVGPAGPVDPALSILAVQSARGRPIALLANYSMHYYGSGILSADYFGLFAKKVEQALGGGADGAPVVGIMSQGTSGDLHWMDYSRPKKPQTMAAYADGLARLACEAYKRIKFAHSVPVAMRERKLTLPVRMPDKDRLTWARKIIAELAEGKKHGTWQRVYSREQIHVHEAPLRELKLQALRIGEMGIVAIPCEVYGITGLKIKARSPLVPTVNFELANGAEGYIPPPEQHALGGYTTWEARSARLEVHAEPKIVDAVLGLLEDVAGKPRREPAIPHGAYAKAVLASKPLAYWRMEDISGPEATDSSGSDCRGRYEDGVAFYLSGPGRASFSGQGAINRAAHFAGGRMTAGLEGLGDAYTIELWFWNGLPSDARPVTGYLFSRGRDGAEGAPGDHLGIGGTHEKRAKGRLIFFNGNKQAELLVGRSEIGLRRWHHVALVRRGRKVAVYLDGETKAEIAGEADVAAGARTGQVFVGGRCDSFANFEGKIDEVAVYGRALTADQIALHYAASGR